MSFQKMKHLGKVNFLNTLKKMRPFIDGYFIVSLYKYMIADFMKNSRI